jgi:hypothetical protein
VREGPSTEVLSGAAGWSCAAASWLDGELLAESIPIISGKVTAAASLAIPEALTFTVPQFADEISWVPDSPTHPLGKFGQTIDLSINVTSSFSGEVTGTRIGRFLICDWEYDKNAGTIEVSCLGTLKVVDEDRFLVPEVPASAGTLASEFRRLMSPGIPVEIDEDLDDRTCPRSFQWDQDRLAALYDIADAWPARLRTDATGTVTLLPPLDDVPDPVIYLAEGESGTVLSAPTSDTRAEVYNVVVVTSSATDDAARPPVRAVASQATGPLTASSDGTGYGRVPKFYSSPLITTQAQAQAAANTMLANSARPAVVRSIECAPDPRIDLDDAVEITLLDEDVERGWVVGYELPLTVQDGAMRVDVGIA